MVFVPYAHRLRNGLRPARVGLHFLRLLRFSRRVALIKSSLRICVAVVEAFASRIISHLPDLYIGFPPR